MKAKDIMTGEVVTVKKDTPVQEIAQILIDKRISGVPVVDDEGNLEGIVTEADLVYREKNIHIPTMISLLGGVLYLEPPKHLEQELKKISGAKAGDIMTREVVTITEDTDMRDIATLMIKKRFHVFPVVRDKKVVGIVSKADMIRTMLR